MNRQNQPPFSPDMEAGFDEISSLLSISTSILARSGDLTAFLDWIADAGPLLAPGFAAAIDPRTGPASNAFRAIGLEIYQATPIPDENFRRITVPKPGRNEPCFCGSGHKYKHCCLALEGGLDLRGFNLLPFVLDALPKKALAGLPDTAVDVDMVADTAMQWQGEGETARAVALLEPWFKKPRKLTAELEYLFDQLMDCYWMLGNDRKRQHLLDEVIARGDRGLRATALQRKATMEADRGDMDAAWATFHEAQRLDPDNPALSALEVTLLVSRGEMEQARKRAQFWAARLERRRDSDYQDMIGFLREVAADPSAAMARLSRDGNPDVDWLAQLLETAPAPATHYRVEGDEDGGFLVPDRKIEAVESTWQKVFPQRKPALTATQHHDETVWESAPDWLPVLESSPFAWQSFDILDDLVMAVDALPLMGIDTSLLTPLLNRATALLDSNLAAAEADNIILPWACLENRPVLRLLAHQAFRILDANENGAIQYSGMAFIKPAERLLALNPHDNHGLRPYLARAYIECGASGKALALSDRYPDDFCAMTLNRILALFCLERTDDAREALHDAAGQHSVAINMLLAANPKKPRLSEHGIRIGGKDEAWIYRSEHRALWEKDGALAWLRTEWKKLPASMPGR